MNNRYEQKMRAIFVLCIALFMSSLNLYFIKEFKETEVYSLEYTAVDIRDMSMPKVSEKEDLLEDNDVVTEIEKVTNLNFINKNESNSTLKAVDLPLIEKKNNTTTAVVSVSNNVNRPTWRLPVEVGVITTWPNYNHVALDITSWRGTKETIYPVADGEISGIYYDYAGALIVMVHHYINGVHYTSQYVHLSSYAPGIYVGMPVNTDTPLGQMGSTGISTGNHLHISVASCSYGNPNDTNCADLNGFFRFLKVEYQQGNQGLNSLMNVPWSWTSR